MVSFLTFLACKGLNVESPDLLSAFLLIEDTIFESATISLRDRIAIEYVLGFIQGVLIPSLVVALVLGLADNLCPLVHHRVGQVGVDIGGHDAFVLSLGGFDGHPTLG